MIKAEEIYVEICKLPIDEQVKFFDWAKEFIKETEKAIKEKQNELNSQTGHVFRAN